MKLIYLGKITSTHGIKGELKIHSNFEYKIQAFRVGNHLTINNVDYTIKSYRRHKDFDMVTLNDYKDINEVQFLLKQKVYIKEEELNLGNDEVLDEELLKYKVIINNDIGFIKEIFFASPTNKVLRININNKEQRQQCRENKEILVPYQKEFITNIDKLNQMIYIKVIDGMILWR